MPFITLSDLRRALKYNHALHISPFYRGYTFGQYVEFKPKGK